MSDLQNRAMRNRLDLLNQATQQQQIGANIRLGAPTVTSTSQAGIGSRVAGLGDALGRGVDVIRKTDWFGDNDNQEGQS